MSGWPEPAVPREENCFCPRGGSLRTFCFGSCRLLLLGLGGLTHTLFFPDGLVEHRLEPSLMFLDTEDDRGGRRRRRSIVSSPLLALAFLRACALEFGLGSS